MPRPNRSPLAYMGVDAPNPPNIIIAQENPGNDDRYDLGTVWINEVTNNVYMLTSVTAGVPYWVSIAADAMTNYVVDDSDPTAYSTVQSAINAANTAGIPAVIYIRPGTDGIYTENLTLYDNIMLEGAGLETTITGAHTPPASGTVVMHNLTLTSATDIFTSAAAGTTQILLFNCLINCTNGFTFDLDNWTGALQLVQCAEASTANGVVNNTGGATVTLWNSIAGAGTTSDMVLDDGVLTMYGSRLVCQTTFGGATTLAITMGSSIGGTMTVSGTVSGNINQTTFSTGATACFSQGGAGQINFSNCTFDTSNNPAIDGAGAGALMLGSCEFLDGSNLSAALTLTYTNETRTCKVLAGDSTYRVSTFNADSNIIQAYAVDTSTGATYNKAIRGDMSVTGGDGNSSPQAVRANTNLASGAHTEEIYAGYAYASHADGGQIDSNQIGALAMAHVYETDAADQAQQWIAGTQSIVAFDAGAAVPTATIVTAALAHVTYDAPLNTLAHGYTISRNGGGAGGAAGSAFKVVAGGGIADWTYGLDLQTEGAGAAIYYGTADIRLANGLLIDSLDTTNTQATVPDTGIFSFSGTDTLETLYVGNDVDVAIADEVEAARGWLSIQSGASVLQATGIMGLMTQGDGSAITSTASGVEGWLNLLETDNADLPPTYAFAVKGYLDSTDTAGIPAGMVAGVGSVVEYNTPFNDKAYGFVATRLDAGAGTGTMAQAAYGVLQGTVAAADWEYGVDLYNGGAGVAYNTADIRLWDTSTITSNASAVTLSVVAGDDFDVELGDDAGANLLTISNNSGTRRAYISSSGDIYGRNINVTNTNITSFNIDPILQSNANTGAAPTGATGDYNIMYCQDGVTMKQFILGAGQTIIAPRLADDGLLISLDLTNSEGAEYYFGHTTRSRHSFVIGTDEAFFVEASFKVADCGTSDPLFLGFRINSAPNATFANYTDVGCIGLHATTNADTVIIADRLNSGALTYTNTTDAWADGETHTLRVNVSGAGVVTYLIDGAAPSVTHALTFDNGDRVIPFLHHLFSAGGSPAAIHIQTFKCGYQNGA